MNKKVTDKDEGITPKGIVRAYQKVFKSKDGQVVLAHLNKSFNTGEPAFQLRVADDSGQRPVYCYDPIHAALKDGGRAVMIHIEKLRDQKIEPDDGKKQQVEVKK